MKTALVAAVFVLGADLCAVALLLGWHLRRRQPTTVVSWPEPVSTWDEWVDGAVQVTEPERETERPQVIVLGTPGHRRMVCRDCVRARTAGRFGAICAQCEPLLIGKEARP